MDATDPFSLLPLRFASPDASLFSSFAISSAFCLVFTMSTTTSSLSGNGGGGGGGGGLAKLRKISDIAKDEKYDTNIVNDISSFVLGYYK